jgi:RNA polymerase sigma-70 factor (family 1)
MKINSESNTCNESVFSVFFKTHVKSLRNYLYYKYGNIDRAEDITQDAFIKLWQNCTEVPIEKAKSFIYTVANNSSLNALAHEKVILSFEKKNIQSENNIETPEFLLEEEQFKNRLTKAIENLNETQRVAFLMHRIDGKKYSEIAEELNISVKAVEKRIHQALIELRKQFENFK